MFIQRRKTLSLRYFSPCIETVAGTFVTNLSIESDCFDRSKNKFPSPLKLCIRS